MSNEYKAYLIRFQRGQGETSWRAALQNAYRDETLRFGNERELFHYLLNILNDIDNEAGSAEKEDK
jgi:hypothetical protein